jgi:hypothetical protein
MVASPKGLGPENNAVTSSVLEKYRNQEVASTSSYRDYALFVSNHFKTMKMFPSASFSLHLAKILLVERKAITRGLRKLRTS